MRAPAAATSPAAGPDAAAVRVAVERVLGEVEFEPPVSVAYTAAVRDALRALLPPGTSVDVYFTTSPTRPLFVVEVRAGSMRARREVDLS